VRIDGNTASVLTVDSSTTVFNPHPEKPALDEASSRLELAKVIQSALLNGIIHGPRLPLVYKTRQGQLLLLLI